MQIGSTRNHLQSASAVPSGAARNVNVQNAKVYWMAASTAKMMPDEGCVLCAQRQENVCSVARADRPHACNERLVGRRTLVPVAPGDEDADSRKQLAKWLIRDCKIERTRSLSTRVGMCSLEHWKQAALACAGSWWDESIRVGSAWRRRCR